MYILRGVSGSGKSTLARTLISAGGQILSSDDFFYNPVTENYDWNTASLPKAHYWNQVRTKLAMQKQIAPLVIDNTNLQVINHSSSISTHRCYP
jgi:adenylate kinase family enzyme